MFSTREPTMFFPETHAARAVVVRSTHKFVKKDESASGSWELFDNRTDFQPGNIRQVFFRTGATTYKFMGAFRCVFRSEMSLGQVPNFPNFVRSNAPPSFLLLLWIQDPHNIIRNRCRNRSNRRRPLRENRRRMLTGYGRSR